jgi:hypothetical protein
MHGGLPGMDLSLENPDLTLRFSFVVKTAGDFPFVGKSQPLFAVAEA